MPGGWLDDKALKLKTWCLNSNHNITGPKKGKMLFSMFWMKWYHNIYIVHIKIFFLLTLRFFVCRQTWFRVAAKVCKFPQEVKHCIHQSNYINTMFGLPSWNGPFNSGSNKSNMWTPFINISYNCASDTFKW